MSDDAVCKQYTAPNVRESGGVDDRDGTTSWDGNERRGMQRHMNTARTIVEFIGAVVLAFIAFTLSNLRQDTSKALEIAQQLQVSQSRTEAKVDAVIMRVNRIEAQNDRGGP